MCPRNLCPLDHFPRRVSLSNLGESTSVLYPPSFDRLARADQLGHVQGNCLHGHKDPNVDPMAALLEEESPYAEVRVRFAVANTDDPEMHSSTFRGWVVSLI
jgi:hypothetical protein